MIPIRWKTVGGMALVACMAIPVQAGQIAGAEAPNIQLAKRVDGGEVDRLARLPPPAMPMHAPALLPPGLDAWLAALEPSPMTALATLPVPRPEGENLTRGVDPSRVRSWAELVDPAMAMHWLVLARLGGFVSEALLQRPDARPGQEGPGFRKTSRSSGAGEGAKPPLAGQKAVQEWLKLPTPAPRANPWLSGLDGYRY